MVPHCFFGTLLPAILLPHRAFPVQQVIMHAADVRTRVKTGRCPPLPRADYDP